MLESTGDRHLSLHTGIDENGYIHVEQDGLFDDISVEVQTDPDTWKNLTEFAEDEPQNTEINM